MFTSEGNIFWLFPSGYTDFILGPFVYRNQYAAFIETVLPLALYEAIKSQRHSLRYWTMASIMVASVFAGASRAGAILVILEVLAVPLLAVTRGMLPARTAVLALGRFVALAAVFTAVVGWDYLWQRFQQADPYVVRREMLISSVHMAQDRPWTGFGMGTWPVVYPTYALFDDGLFANQAHNDWAQWTVEGGLPLAASMLVFAAILAVPAFRSIWGVGMISVLLHCLVDYPMQQRPALAGWFFAIAATVLRAEAARRRTRRPGEM
jgi:O-antigen ligase